MNKLLVWVVGFGSIVSFAGMPLQAMADPVALNTDWVYSQVKTHDLRAPEDLLALLPADYRSSYTLVYDTHGLQPASKQAPRVIFFGADARMVLAVGGEGGGLTPNTLEMIQFREDTRAFEFREIQFPDAVGRTQSAIFSEVNPSKCTACHGKDPRPNWNSYGEWPGVFGSADDLIYSDEAPTFQKFLQQSAASPLYRNLVKMEGVPLWPYRQPGGGPGSSGPDSMTFRPNTRLGVLFSGLNALHLERRLESAPLFAKYGALLLARMTGCEQASDPVQGADVLAALAADFPATQSYTLRRQYSRQVPVSTDYLARDGVKDPISALLIGAMGIDYQAFNLDYFYRPKTQTFNYYDGVHDEALILVDALIRRAAQEDPSLSQFIVDDTDPYSNTAPGFLPFLPDNHDPYQVQGACPELWKRAQASVHSTLAAPAALRD